MKFTRNSFLICRPDYFDVVYEINPWMSVHNRPVKQDVRFQWFSLEKQMQDLNIDLHYIEPQPDLPDMVFTANGGLVKGNKAVIPKMKTKEREPEEKYFKEWFKKHGFEIYQPKKHSFEGEGDAFIVDDILFAGHGIRSDLAVYDEIKEFLGLKKVISIRLINNKYYHLDTCFTPLFNGKALIVESAVDGFDLQKLSRHLDLIPVNAADAFRFVCNAVVVENKIILPSDCHDTSYELHKMGFETYPVPLGQFLKAGGSAKCLSLRLKN